MVTILQLNFFESHSSILAFLLLLEIGFAEVSRFDPMCCSLDSFYLVNVSSTRMVVMWFGLLCLCLTLSSEKLFTTATVNNKCAGDSFVLETLAASYRNNTFLPRSDGAVIVTIELWVQEISKINELRSEFELDIYVTEYWQDPSLVFDHLKPCKNNISLDSGKWRDKFWNPNTCFVNSKKAKIHRSPFTNIFLMIVRNHISSLNLNLKFTVITRNL